MEARLGRELEIQDAVATSLEMRRVMVGALKQSQQLEHKFYADCREAVRKASSQLAEHFSDLIQRQMPHWTERDCNDFVRHSGVSPTNLSRWQTCFAALMVARANASSAATALKAAEVARNDSGGFFGAKKGRDDDYRSALVAYQGASGSHDMAKQRLAHVMKDATAAAEALLEDCVSRAASLAESNDYELSRTPAGILVEAATRAAMLTKAHNREQSILNSELHHGIQGLIELYGRSHE